jgi:hypothetical protein
MAVAVAALIPSIYGAALPPLSTVRAEPSAAHIEVSEKSAGFTAAAVVAGVAVASGSGEVAVIGGAMVLAYALLYRTARKDDD